VTWVLVLFVSYIKVNIKVNITPIFSYTEIRCKTILQVVDEDWALLYQSLSSPNSS